MSNIEIINELDERGSLKPLINAGLFPAKVLFHRDIYFFVNAQLKQGIKKKSAVMNAEDRFKVKERTIYRVMAALS